MRKMPDYEAFIFDMDGLMFDTEPIYYRSWSEAAELLGYHLSKEFFSETQGRNNRDAEKILIQYTDPSININRFRELWKDKWFQLGRESGINLKPGLTELLEWLRLNGFPLALATSSNLEIMDFCLNETGLDDYFREKVCGQEVKAGKPKPDIYLEAAKRLNVTPSKCIVLEDSSSGAKAGVAAGMMVFLIPDQIDPPDDVKQQVYHIANDLHQVLKTLNH